MLSLEGCIVTGDALHCNRAVCLEKETVLKRGPAITRLRSRKIRASCSMPSRGVLPAPASRSVAERREPATHDRCEWRRATVLRDTTFAAVQKFPGVVALARITSRRRVLGACAEPPQVRYFLLSKYIPAKQLLRIVRSHWGIENQLHWVLDVVFNEDRNRTRKDNAPENLAILRKLALNLVRSHPAATSLRQKIKRAGWDDAFLLGMLGHMR